MVNWYVAIVDRTDKNKMLVKKAASEEEASEMRKHYSNLGWLSMIIHEDEFKRMKEDGRC